VKNSNFEETPFLDTGTLTSLTHQNYNKIWF